MHKFVLNLTAMAISAALVPTTARAEANQRPTTSDCAGFSVQECLVDAECSFAVTRCKDLARECRALTTTSVPSPTASAKAVTHKPTLPSGGEWIQNEYWPEACYIVDHQIVLCESDLTDAQRAALGMAPRPSPSDATPVDCGPQPPDCALLEPLNDPDAIRNCEQWHRWYRECTTHAASSSTRSAPPAPTRSTPDCTRLINENHPDCRP